MRQVGVGMEGVFGNSQVPLKLPASSSFHRKLGVQCSLVFTPFHIPHILLLSVEFPNSESLMRRCVTVLSQMQREPRA